MTEKKEKILDSALRLFASEGYQGTSTARLARDADVSEGLIFRHFGSKEGLLNAIIEMGTNRAMQYFAPCIIETDPKKVIKNTLELPFKVSNEDREFWKLQMAIKVQARNYPDKTMEPLIQSLTNAFMELKYKDPKGEAKLLLLLMEGISMSIIKGNLLNEDKFRKFLLKKYEV